MSLSVRFAIILAVLLGGIGTALVIAGRYASELYFHEVNQSLNGSIAMYVVDRLPLIEAQRVNEDALATLAEQAMTVNPSVEVYLLSTEGQVVAHAMPNATLVNDVIDLNPVHHFLNRTTDRLILGDDPRTGEQKAFSAFPIDSPEGRQGYLYVVLGGALFDAVQETFFGSFIGRIAAAGLLVALLFGGVVGYLLLSRVSRPLNELRDAVQTYSGTGFTDDSAIRQVAESVTEVAELKAEVQRLTERLAQQFDALSTNDRLRRELLANFSHDLRTPLASMQGYVETLLIKDATLDTEKRRQLLSVAHRHTLLLSRMVGELFELAKLESGAQPMEEEPFCLAELLHDVVQEFELSANERQIKLSVDGCGDGEARLVHGDISLIQRVFENLVSNALRYTPEGGQIVVALVPEQERISVAVSDSGCGIEPAVLPTIFERHSGHAHDEGHSGLGLAIVKRILELHGSVIEVTSRPDLGTTFTFALPRAA